MKRKNNLYNQIPIHENLREAFRKAAKGKHGRSEVILFRSDFDANIEKIRHQLLDKSPDIGHYRFFQVRDPKPRSICAASFPERVLHHAIMNICEPVLDACAISDSYACRKGKGNRKALAKAKAFSKQFPWYLKLDIRKYFDTADHEIMIQLLSKRIKDRDVLMLFRKILDTYSTAQDKGIPIGNLISQHLANFYLDTFDHQIKEERRIRGYLRYMDDFVLFGNSKSFLRTELELVRLFLKDKLELELRNNIQLNKCIRGIPFLGFRVFPNKISLSPRSLRRFSIKFREYENNYLHGLWTDTEFVRHMESLADFTKAADSAGFRRNVIQQFGVLS